MHGLLDVTVVPLFTCVRILDYSLTPARSFMLPYYAALSRFCLSLCLSHSSMLFMFLFTFYFFLPLFDPRASLSRPSFGAALLVYFLLRKLYCLSQPTSLCLAQETRKLFARSSSPLNWKRKNATCRVQMLLYGSISIISNGIT